MFDHQGAVDYQPSVAFSDLCVDFKTFRALHGVSGRLHRNGVTGLAGANGAGKTTLLHTLLGLIGPTSGAVTRSGAPTSIAYCADTPDFEPWLSAREALAHSMAVAGRARSSDDAERIDEVLGTVGLDDAATRRVGGYSRGMKLRLGIAAAVILRPRVLMLDEPTSALDPIGRHEILCLIEHLGTHMQILFSSHQLADIEQVAQRLIVIDHGWIIFDGPLSGFLTGHDDEYSVEFAEGLPSVGFHQHEGRLRWRVDEERHNVVHVSAPSMAAVLDVVAPMADRVVSIQRRKPSLYSAFIAAVADREAGPTP